MGYDLREWALHVEHPCLTPRTRQVLAEICFVAHDEHGEFWMRGRNFLDENIPDMSYGAYRNHLSVLVRNGLLLKSGHGGGPINRGRGTTTRYRVNSPAVRNPQPAQHVLPEIVRSPEALQRSPEVADERPSVSAIEAHRHLDELMAAGITPERLVAMLKAVSTTLTGSPDMSDGVTCSGQMSDLPEEHVRLNMSGGVTGSVNMSGEVTGSAAQTCQKTGHVRAEHVSSPDTPSTHEEKIHEEKEDHAAAANMSDATSECLTGFFDVLVRSLARAGHPGIRAAQFEDLTGLLARYQKLTGSAPDEHTADYIAGRVSDSRGVRNVVGFARRITRDVLTTGEGFVAGLAREPPPVSLPASTREHKFAPEPPDWDLLHLAHVEQVSPVQQVWASVLEVLRSQVPRPAFETWLVGSEGWAFAAGQFVVSTPSQFATEMLEKRLHPLIERAVREVVGADLGIKYTVAPRDGELCPRCQAQDTQAEAS